MSLFFNLIYIKINDSTMALLYDMAFNLRTDDSKLTEGLKKAGGKIKNFGEDTKKNTEGISDAFKSMGNMIGGELDRMTGGLSGMLRGMKVLVPGVNGVSGAMKLLKVAIASTGVGLLVVALGALYSYFTGTKKGAEMFSKALGGIKAVIDNLMQRLHLLGEAIALVMQGKFREAAATAKKAFGEMDNTIKESYEKGRALAERATRLEEQKIAFITKEAALRLEIDKNREIANNKELSRAEQEQANIAAMKAQNELFDIKIALATEEAAILKEKNALGDNLNENDREEAELQAEILALKSEQSKMIKRMNSERAMILGIKREDLEAQQKINDELDGAIKKARAILSIKEVAARIKGINPLDNAENSDFKMDDEEFNDMDDPWIAQMGQRQIALLNFQQGLVDFAAIGKVSLDEFLDTALEGFAKLGSALSNGAQSFKEYAKNIRKSVKDVINAQISKGIAFLVTAALETAGLTGPGAIFLAPALTAAAAGIAKTAFNSLIPKFADGGIFTSPTLGVFGEYPNAKRDPEIAGKLSDVTKYLQPSLQDSAYNVSYVDIPGDIFRFKLEKGYRKLSYV